MPQAAKQQIVKQIYPKGQVVAGSFEMFDMPFA